MNNGNSLRIGAILAMVLGCFYVLAPTLLIDEMAERTEQASQVQVTEVTAPKLVVAFSTTGSPQDGVVAVSNRLAALDIEVASVGVSDGQVEVKMLPGTRREQIVEAVTRSPKVQWFNPTLLLSAAPDEAAAAQILADMAGKPVPFQLAEVPLKTGTLQKDEGVFPMMSPAPEGVTKLIVAVDGLAVGVGTPLPVQNEMYPVSFQGFTGQEDAIRWLSTSAFEDEIKAVTAEAPSSAPDVALVEEPAAQSHIPAWLDGLLIKSNRLNLGIDLRGGIDLTLQVGIEDAILSRAHRDQASLVADIQRDFGGEVPAELSDPTADFMVSCQKAISGGAGEEVTVNEGWLATDVRYDRDEPKIYVESELALGDVQRYLVRRLDNYEYVETAKSEKTGRDIHTFVMTKAAQETLADEAINQVLETLRRRIDATGVKEPTIVRKGGGAISVQLPGMDNLKSAVDAIGTTAVLEFLLNEHELAEHLGKAGLPLNSPGELERIAQDALPDDQFQDDKLVDRWLHEEGFLPEDRVMRWRYDELPDKTQVRSEAMVLKRDLSPLTGADVNDAGVGMGQQGEVVVTLSFKPRGTAKFCDLTTDNVGKQFAILLDDKIMSAPSIRTSICGGRAQIEMGGSTDPQQEAQNLALVLRTGSLNAPVNVGEVRIVGSTLGADAIRAGTRASLIGSFLVLLFMGLWYRSAGIAANISLAINVLLVFTCLALFGASLTLPGIAGVALTVGMAVDANIIIYERIREELRMGVAARKAVDVGFEKALVAVLDANITTAIAGVVLFSYGTGPIKGFAVTLLIGILTTLVSALFVNRTLMDLLTRSSTARLKI